MFRIRRQLPVPTKIAIAVVATALITGPVAVLASHGFSDVGNNHPFHHEIGVVSDAGIALGFNDGTYRPGDTTTRQAMAAFLERAVGRVGSATPTEISGTVTLGINPSLPVSAVIAEVGIDAGAAGAGTTGFVYLIGTISAQTSTPNDCPCSLNIQLRQDAEPGDDTAVDVPGQANSTGSSTASATAHSVVPISGDESRSFQLVVTLNDQDVPSVIVSGRLSAIYVPLGPDGDDTLEYEHSCTATESESNDSSASANFLVSGGCVTGSFTDGDIDTYLITVDSNQTLTLETKSVDGAGCGTDTLVKLLNADGNTVIDEDNDGGVGRCSYLVISDLAAGNYYVEVHPLVGGLSRYRLTATQEPT